MPMMTDTRTQMTPRLEAAVERIEQGHVLDGVAAALQGVLGKVLPEGSAGDLLRGTPLGHPAHPALILVPAGAWTSATLADLLGERTAARRLTAVGCISAVPAAAAGAADYVSLDGARRRVGTVHAAANLAALTCYTMSWSARHSGRRTRGFLLSLAGAGFLTAGGWLGGHLAYSQGVGVDTTDFHQRQLREATAADPDEQRPANQPSHV